MNKVVIDFVSDSKRVKGNTTLLDGVALLRVKAKDFPGIPDDRK